jgi:IclR family mhp operon transcriptional activator
MREDKASPYRHVQGLSRGLSLLHALNRAERGIASIPDLCAATGLHRTTVRRMLETLEQEGYVRRSHSDDSYRLNHKVRQLSDGFTDDEWISELAAPVLGELLHRVIWPSDLCTVDGDAMVVRETTHRFSPLSFHRAMIRQRMPLLSTAAGRAFLAYCSDAKREQLLRLLRAGTGEQASLARKESVVAQILDRVRQNGYATNEGEWTSQLMVSALGLPIFHRGSILGSINLVYLRKAMPISEAAQRYLPDLRAAVHKIEGLLEENPRALMSSDQATPSYVDWSAPLESWEDSIL